MPRLFQLSTRLRLELAAQQTAATLARARLLAARHGTWMAVRFRHLADDTIRLELLRDGDGDGVLTRDLEEGVDTVVDPARRLTLGGGIDFGFPPGRAPVDPSDPGRRLDRLDDPIRFGRSDMASFSAHGTASPGTAYLTDGRHLVAVRVLNRTGKFRVQTYDADAERWSP